MVSYKTAENAAVAMRDSDGGQRLKRFSITAECLVQIASCAFTVENHLPDEVEVVRAETEIIRADARRLDIVNIIIQHDSFDPVPEGASIPYIKGLVIRKSPYHVSEEDAGLTGFTYSGLHTPHQKHLGSAGYDCCADHALWNTRSFKGYPDDKQ